MQKYDFSQEFQERVLASALRSRSKLKRNLQLLDGGLYDDEVLGAVADSVREFWEKYRELPDRVALEKETMVRVAPGRDPDEYRRIIGRVTSEDGFEPDYYLDHARTFVRSQNIIGALSAARLQAESGELDEVLKTVRQASQGSVSKEPVDWLTGARKRVLQYKSGKLRKNTFPTGFGSLDEVMNGGLGVGELGAVMAPPKRGKSTTLCNIGRGAVMAGHKVLHVTLELSDDIILSKYDSLFLGRTLTSIGKKPKRFMKLVRKLKEKVEDKLKVVQFPTKRLSVDELSGLVSEVSPDVVIVDYADLMLSRRKSEQRRFELIDIWESLRGLAGDCNVAIWTGTQANRMSIGQNLVGIEHAAECFEKIAICDIVLSVCQTQDEADISRLRLYVPASRVSETGVEVQCTCDWKKSSIKEESV